APPSTAASSIRNLPAKPLKEVSVKKTFDVVGQAYGALCKDRKSTFRVSPIISCGFFFAPHVAIQDCPPVLEDAQRTSAEVRLFLRKVNSQPAAEESLIRVRLFLDLVPGDEKMAAASPRRFLEVDARPGTQLRELLQYCKLGVGAGKEEPRGVCFAASAGATATTSALSPTSKSIADVQKAWQEQRTGDQKNMNDPSAVIELSVCDTKAAKTPVPPSIGSTSSKRPAGQGKDAEPAKKQRKMEEPKAPRVVTAKKEDANKSASNQKPGFGTANLKWRRHPHAEMELQHTVGHTLEPLKATMIRQQHPPPRLQGHLRSPIWKLSARHSGRGTCYLTLNRLRS
ncbi:unnamed protein product, partial [Amoebophrya sp. A120]